MKPWAFITVLIAFALSGAVVILAIPGLFERGFHGEWWLLTAALVAVASALVLRLTGGVRPRRH